MRKKSKSLRRKNTKKSRKRSSKARKSSPKLKKSKGCFRSNQSKYLSRPGPPYPAQDCKNYSHLGNDGYYYKSVPDKNGRYRWVKIKE
jgi:hypothetical protein